VIRCNNAFPDNYIRFNGWNGFLERATLELAAKDNAFFSTATNALDELGWKYQAAPDAPGMIAARVVAMIINEAYFALGEDLSSKKEIDIAMRTGTNYPYGPFEWSEKIGLKNVYSLLEKLKEKDARYTPAPGLAKEV
jgi:3-hydroxybutyryl-CoA dehydrogenase